MAEFVAKLDAGWEPKPLSKDEDLKRRKDLIQAMFDRVLNNSPVAEKRLAHAMAIGASLHEMQPLIRVVWERADARWPGIKGLVERMTLDFESRGGVR
jgi:hypothetical protein